MSDEQNTANGQSREELELALLKERADTLGISYKGNIGLETLRNKVNEHIEKGKQPEPTETAPVAKSEAPAVDNRSPEQKLRDELRKEHLALVRCRIYNLNPQKNDLPGEIITVANRYLGTVSKMIPFGEATDNGYHIPKIIMTELQNRKFQQILIKKDKETGKEIVTQRMVPEYQIEVLPMLSPEELEELAVRQAAAQRLGA